MVGGVFTEASDGNTTGIRTVQLSTFTSFHFSAKSMGNDMSLRCSAHSFAFDTALVPDVSGELRHFHFLLEVALETTEQDLAL